MTGFLGEYEVTLDSKGRFLLPAGLKKQLPDGDSASFVINRGFEKCLTLYPLSSWEPIYSKIAKLNDFDPKVREFRRWFLNGAIQMELDSAGRMLIPKNLIEHAGLEKVREFRRWFLNGAIQMELDSAGRMLIPKNLIEHAGLEKDMVLVSAVNKIEIWDKKKYQEFFDSYSPEAFSDVAAQVMNGNIE